MTQLRAFAAAGTLSQPQRFVVGAGETLDEAYGAGAWLATDTPAVSIAAHDREADLRVRAPGYTPLSTAEPHAELAVTGADVDVTVTLSGPQVEALREALADADE